MVAGGHHVHAQFQEFLGDGRGDTEASGGILRIGDGQIDLVGFDDVLQVVGDNAAPGRRENITDEKYVHP